LAGLKEATEAFFGKNIYECENGFEFIDGMIQTIQVFLRKMGKKRGKRLSAAIVPDSAASERLAQLDIEKYGIAKVRFSGNRERPFYSTISKLVFQDGKIPAASLLFERKKLGLSTGGSMTAVELGESEHRADELMSLTKQAFENYHAELLAYNRELTYCINCKRSWFGSLHKCPSCGSTGTLTMFDQFEST
jgi:anaerobic ribonucleoside-triphosphate reductase